MKNSRFRRDADLLLGGLTWTREDRNAVLCELRGDQPKMKRKISLATVLVATLALLTAAGLAIGLSYSPRHTAVQTARQAVMAKYGLTADMLRMYGESVSERDGVTTVVYKGAHSEFLDPDAMGDFTVTVSADGGATAAWTHDGVDRAALDAGDLASAVWGPKQLQMVVDRYDYFLRWQEDVKKAAPYLGLLPINEQVKRVAELDAAIAPYRVIAIARTEAPQDGDIPEAKALAIATQAAQDRYGVEMADGWRVERFFQTAGEDNDYGRAYSFSFQKGGMDGATPFEAHTLWVLSPSGEIAGDAGGKLDRDGALRAARKTLAEWYDLTDDMLSLFTAVPSLEEADGRAVWTVAYLPKPEPRMAASPVWTNELIDWRWDHTLRAKLGYYAVWLDADTGKLRDATWSLEGVEYTRDKYTQSDWANAKAYDAYILPWVLDLLERNAPIIAKYPEDQTEWFTAEDAAAYDQAFRDAGFTQGNYNHALPKADDLTAEKAKELAYEAMQNDYGVTMEAINRSQITCEYVQDNGGEWWVGFYTELGMGNVKLNAATGEIQEVYLDAAEASNG